MKTLYIACCLLGAMALTKFTYAGETNFGTKTPTTNQVIDALSPALDNRDDINTNHTGKARSIDMSGLLAPKAKTNSKVKNPRHKGDSEIALSMEILFAYKSAELTAAAKNQLKPVGAAFASEKLQNLGFVVEGHTDAIGSDAYNKKLSEERALSVRQFLADAFHIDTARMQIIGKGKSDLLDPKNPGSEVNRRVRIIARK